MKKIIAKLNKMEELHWWITDPKRRTEYIILSLGKRINQMLLWSKLTQCPNINSHIKHVHSHCWQQQLNYKWISKWTILFLRLHATTIHLWCVLKQQYVKWLVLMSNCIFDSKVAKSWQSWTNAAIYHKRKGLWLWVKRSVF